MKPNPESVRAQLVAPQLNLRRRSIRLKDYDYSQPGGYFVTINFRCSKIKQNSLKDSLSANLYYLEQKFRRVKFDSWILMDDHIHLIILILDTDLGKDKAPKYSLGEYIRQLKALVTQDMRNCYEIPFDWHRNYYERILRNEKELDRFRRYISNNPLTKDLEAHSEATSIFQGEILQAYGDR